MTFQMWFEALLPTLSLLTISGGALPGAEIALWESNRKNR